MSLPLMPKATAIWLVDNTTLTFDQIAAFCSLHPLEVQGIADGDVAQNMAGQDPVATNQLTREEIERCQGDATARLNIIESDMPEPKKRKGPRYTPVSKRQDRPDAIAWLVRNHPELSDAQVGKMIGTTKPTISAIRDRTHWNISNVKPTDPVTLGLCSQIELDEAIQKAAAKLERGSKKKGSAKEPAAAVIPEPLVVVVSAAKPAPEPEAPALAPAATAPEEAEPVAEDVFGPATAPAKQPSEAD